MRTSRGAACLVLLLAGCAHKPAQTTWPVRDEDTVELDLTSGPQPDGWIRARWPLKEAHRGKEGWVDLQFMIDTSGKPYEIVVTDSTGSKAFEAAAIRSSNKWSFKPAVSSAGELVEAGYSMRLYFYHWEIAGVSRRFRRSYQQVSAAIADGDRARSEAALGQLLAENLYEDAFASLARYQFEAKWGTEAGQLSALRRAMETQPGPRFIPRSQFITMLQTLLNLQLRARDFAGALSTWEKLEYMKPDEESMAQLQPVIADAVALRKDQRAYSVPGEISAAASSWFYTLYKQRFQVVVSSGHVSEIKLRCDKKYVSFGFDPDLYYRIADQYGNCRLEVVGDSGTLFDLIQS